jgi:hypothetical protein
MESIIMDNDTRSQAKKALGWEIFLDEAKRRFADARTGEERRNLTRSYQGL